MEDGKPLLILSLLILSAFFSSSETALFSLSRIYLKKLENTTGAGGRRVLKLLSKPRRLLITLLLGNTFVNIALSSLATLWAIDIASKVQVFSLSWMITIQVVLVTILILVFGEIIPKLVALATADKLSVFLSLPLQIIQILLWPFVSIFIWISQMVSRKSTTDKHLGSRFTTEEFHKLIQSESSKHSLEEHEKKMLVGLFRFKEAEISEIYVPRVKITAIEENQSLDELRDLIISSGYSRIPVYRESIDDIIGIIYVKDLLLYPDRNSIKEYIRPAWFVTENMKVQTLLNQFKSKKLQVAIVVDEYGGTSGIISLEDILEEIVGEIQDEYDLDESPEIVKINDHEYDICGSYGIRQFNHEFGTDLNTEEYDNIAQFLLENFNHVPSISESFVLDDRITFTVLESDEKSIKQVRISISKEDEI